MNITDHDIQAYVDGELPPDDAARIEAAVLADVLVAARVERERRLRSMVRGAYEAGLAEPVPECLRAIPGEKALAGTRGAGDNVVAVGARPPALAPRWRLPVTAVAASVAALAVSMWMRPGAPVHMQDGTLLARGTLARELDTALASTPMADVATTVALTFRDADGRICRSFTNSEIAIAGLACREGDRWMLPVVGRLGAESPGAIRPASSAMPGDVQAAVDARLRGDVFDAARERAARDDGWR